MTILEIIIVLIVLFFVGVYIYADTIELLKGEK